MTGPEYIRENDSGSVKRMNGFYYVYENTPGGTNRIGVYEVEDAAIEAFEEL